MSEAARRSGAANDRRKRTRLRYFKRRNEQVRNRASGRAAGSGLRRGAPVGSGASSTSRWQFPFVNLTNQKAVNEHAKEDESGEHEQNFDPFLPSHARFQVAARLLQPDSLILNVIPDFLQFLF